MIQVTRAIATRVSGTGRSSEFVTASTVPNGCGGSLTQVTKAVWASSAPGWSAIQYVTTTTTADAAARVQRVTGVGRCDVSLSPCCVMRAT